MRYAVGTSGFGYAAWKGPFYPQTLPARDWLRFYAERLPAVEINNSFYRMPRASVLESWRDAVPAGFRFALKASRRITHIKRLLEVEEETRILLAASAVLGDRLGALLFQLPPNLRCDLERLQRFLELLPAGTPAAFEFRHASWSDERVDAALAARGSARVGSETDEDDVAELSAQAPLGYLRLRRSDYPRAMLARWAARIRACAWQQAFVFFKHEDAGRGPRLAAELLELLERSDARLPARAVGAGAARRPRREAS